MFQDYKLKLDFLQLRTHGMRMYLGKGNLATDDAATATTWLLPNSVCHLRSKLAFKRLRKAFTFTAPQRRVPREKWLLQHNRGNGTQDVMLEGFSERSQCESSCSHDFSFNQ